MSKAFFYPIALAALGPVVYFWWSNSGSLLTSDPAHMFLALGRLSGLLAAFFVLLQFLLMGRAIWLERTFGLDKLSRVHHLNGFFAFILILTHPFLIVLANSMITGNSVVRQFINTITATQQLVMAFIALIIYIATVSFSLYIVRKRLKYETWFFVHLFNYVAVALVFWHQVDSGEDFLASKMFVYYWYFLYAFVFSNLIIFRIFRPVYLYTKHKFVVEKLERETHDSTSVYITGNNINEFKVLPGQFMIFKFLAKGFWWQSHPFSLSKPLDGKQIRITVKSVGDFTSKITMLSPGTPVIIDGPYGIFTEKVNKMDQILLIAGGIGITPIRSLVEQLAAQHKDIVLISANKAGKDIVFKNELDELGTRFGFSIYYVLSQEQNDRYLYGQVDKEKISQLVKDVIERDVYLCGPIPMMESVRKSLEELGVPAVNIHFEKFSL